MLTFLKFYGVISPNIDYKYSKFKSLDIINCSEDVRVSCPECGSEHTETIYSDDFKDLDYNVSYLIDNNDCANEYIEELESALVNMVYSQIEFDDIPKYKTGGQLLNEFNFNRETREFLEAFNELSFYAGDNDFIFVDKSGAGWTLTIDKHFSKIDYVTRVFPNLKEFFEFPFFPTETELSLYELQGKKHPFIDLINLREKLKSE